MPAPPVPTLPAAPPDPLPPLLVWVRELLSVFEHATISETAAMAKSWPSRAGARMGVVLRKFGKNVRR
jgi:hypothetical protein